MTDGQYQEDPSSTPVVEVVVLRDGVEIRRERCESEEQAAAVVAHWQELHGVECEVVDLSAGQGEGAAEVGWPDGSDDYPIRGSEPDHP